MKPRREELDFATRNVIRAALMVATCEECCAAIDGCKASAFHMGQNDGRVKYNQVTQILKGKRGGRTTREQIEFMLQFAANADLGPSLLSVDRARLNAAKREVLDAFAFPQDEQVAIRGRQAAEWLAQQGWIVERHAVTGQPMFRAPRA